MAEDEPPVGVQEQVRGTGNHAESVTSEIGLRIGRWDEDNRERVPAFRPPTTNEVVLLWANLHANQFESLAAVPVVKSLQSRKLRVARPSSWIEEVEKHHPRRDVRQLQTSPDIGLQVKAIRRFGDSGSDAPRSSNELGRVLVNLPGNRHDAVVCSPVHSLCERPHQGLKREVEHPKARVTASPRLRSARLGSVSESLTVCSCCLR